MTSTSWGSLEHPSAGQHTWSGAQCVWKHVPAMVQVLAPRGYLDTVKLAVTSGNLVEISFDDELYLV